MQISDDVRVYVDEMGFEKGNFYYLITCHDCEVYRIKLRVGTD